MEILENEGTCRYGSLCTFAHGDKEIRTKSQNITFNTTESNPMMSPSPNSYLQTQGRNPYMMGFDQNLILMQNMMDMYQQNPNQMNSNSFVDFSDMQQAMPMSMIGQNMPMAMNLPLIWKIRIRKITKRVKSLN